MISLFLCLFLLFNLSNASAVNIGSPELSIIKWRPSEKELEYLYTYLSKLPEFQKIKFKDFKDKFLNLDELTRYNYKKSIQSYNQSDLSIKRNQFGVRPYYRSFKDWFQMNENEKKEVSKQLNKKILGGLTLNNLKEKMRSLQLLIDNNDDITLDLYKIKSHMTPREYLRLIEEEIRYKSQEKSNKSGSTES